jgi:hypothetical protein
MNNRKGQNTIEYILLVTAVLAVFIIFLNPQGNYKRSVEDAFFNSTLHQVKNASDAITFRP